MIGRWHGIIIDCPNPSALAAFYQELLGMQRVQDDKDWVVIGDAADRPGIAFQRAPDFRPPRWPDPDQPQQMHIDVRVEDLDQAEQKVLALGAPPATRRRRTVPRHADLADHPFCLVSW